MSCARRGSCCARSAPPLPIRSSRPSTSRAHLPPWLAWVDSHLSVDDSRDWCTRCAANWLLRAEVTVGIFAAADGRNLRCASLHDLDWDLRAFRIGYWFRVSAIGQGYATEAVRLLVDLAFGPLAARRVELRY